MYSEENKLQIRKLSEVELQEVTWLWYPYIPSGKITIIQGDPGEGKTTLALRLAAACSTGQALPGMEIVEPFNVIYQTAEDGLGDTIKPRLMEAGADQDRVLNIAEDVNSLTLLDERIEAAIVQTGAKLMILDPIQGYLGGKVDMNRANEIRTVLKNVAAVAERTGCAIVLVGHLNKATGASSAYRGLGSIDFRAAARSVLLVGRMKKEPNVRVIVHDKSSLAPEGKSIAFSLGDENGFCWLDGYNDITSDELLCGFNAETKTAAAEDLIRDLLSDGEKVPCETIFSMAASRGISQRTVNQAKKTSRRSSPQSPVRNGFGRSPNEDCNIAICPFCIVNHCILAEKEDDHGSHLHCCIVNLMPPLRAVLPLCRQNSFLWSRNPNAAENATVGAFSENLRFAPAGAEILLPLGSSQHRVRLVADRRKTGQKPGPTSYFNQDWRFLMKNKKLSIRISEADWQRFHDKAEQADITLTEYITDCCLGKQIVVIDGLDEVIRQQKAIGRNINQLTTLANMGKVKTVYLKELTDAYAQVGSLLSDILKARRWK